MKPLTTSEAKPKPNQFEFEAIGTKWSIEILDHVRSASDDLVLGAVLDRIDQFDRNYSRFRTDSLVSQMAQTVADYQLPADAMPMLDLYQQLYGLTNGSLSPLIGQTLSDAGYDANYSLRHHRTTIAPTWESVMVYDFPRLTLHEPVLLDFGAIGKGYLVDIVGKLLQEAGIASFVVNAGGDILCKLSKGYSIEVALEHPDDRSQAIGIANLGSQSICGSSGGLRQWGEHHHIIDAKTAISPRHIKSVWVVSDTAMISDAMTTALFFVAPEVLLTKFKFEYALVNSDNTIERSSAFPAKFFEAEG
jgi:thiamine biosynthesis lipoprotein